MKARTPDVAPAIGILGSSIFSVGALKAQNKTGQGDALVTYPENKLKAL